MGELIGVPAASITGQQAGPGGLRLEAGPARGEGPRASGGGAARQAAAGGEEQASLKRSIEKAEAFVLRLTSNSQYAVDRKTKREGLRLLRMPAKRAQSPQVHGMPRSGSAAPTFSRPGSARRLSGPRGSAPCFSEAAGAELGEGQDPLLTAQATWRDGLRA
ncbi:unnamed protein product [Prorocentrum cordatum]|uniref:Uncharacterized protein n=1 Tax=Prorocentrum cordatum TaxID=2364126 RepID=A0ABN9W2B5_9DINO|nr:unnamed protein product [Polarella glacialis]